MTTTTTRTWTSIGEQLFDRPLAKQEGHNWVTHFDIEDAIAGLEWQDPPETLPAMQGLAIRALVEDLNLRGIISIALSTVECRSDNEPGVMAYGLYGIRNEFANGVAEIFAVDRGSDILIVASDFPIPT